MSHADHQFCCFVIQIEKVMTRLFAFSRQKNNENQHPQNELKCFSNYLNFPAKNYFKNYLNFCAQKMQKFDMSENIC